MSVEWRPDPKAQMPDPGGWFLSCFPGAGLAATVAGHYMLQVLKLPRIAALVSDDIPPLAVVQGGRVNPPVRAYGSKELVLVVSEFPLPATLINPLAATILDVAAQMKAVGVLGLEGVVPHPSETDGEGDATEQVLKPSDEMVWYAGSGSVTSLPADYKAAGVRSLGDGVIGGVSGALLVRAISSSMPVGALLVSASDAGYPDHRAAAKLIEVIDRVLPHLKIDTQPLRAQAEMIEKALRAAVKNRQSAPSGPLTTDQPPIYQ
jgi:predicted ATP-grasp superfamily ATP-dependent carboligase